MTSSGKNINNLFQLLFGIGYNYGFLVLKQHQVGRFGNPATEKKVITSGYLSPLSCPLVTGSPQKDVKNKSELMLVYASATVV